MCFSWLQKLHKQNLGNTGKYRGRYSKINILYIVLVYFLNLVIKCIYNIKSYIQIICACGLYYIYIYSLITIFSYMFYICQFFVGAERAWQLTPVFLPGESYGQRSMAGYSHTELDTNEVTQHACMQSQYFVYTFFIFQNQCYRANHRHLTHFKKS